MRPADRIGLLDNVQFDTVQISPKLGIQQIMESASPCARTMLVLCLAMHLLTIIPFRKLILLRRWQINCREARLLPMLAVNCIPDGSRKQCKKKERRICRFMSKPLHLLSIALCGLKWKKRTVCYSMPSNHLRYSIILRLNSSDIFLFCFLYFTCLPSAPGSGPWNVKIQ